jgi:DNA mismatch repair protein MutS2
MNERTFRVLEYDKIIEALKGQAGSEMTRGVIEGLRPETEVRIVEDALAETSEAVTLITYKGPLPLGNFYDISGYLSLAAKGGTLGMAELLRVLYNISVAGRVTAFLRGDLPSLPILQAMGEVLEAYPDLEKDLDRCILSEDEMSDNASTQLRTIRRSIVRQNEALRSKMNQIVNSSQNKAILQDAIITIRDGRYVVPVKAEHRGRVPGIVHDQSASGATLFIEPQAIVNLNNELRQLEIEERAEVARILKELTERVGEHREGLANNQDLLVKMDLMMAKGKLASLQKAECPKINEEGRLNLKEARHPLIDKKSVVPINVSVGGSYRGLIITGPNTGGKTVTLKTCGLLAMMAQTGLHIPATSGSTLPIYHEIFADIGDEQSIEQSLSTFSSHMSNIVGITSGAGKDTLVLLDELGAGTDPTEGAALAIAILESLLDSGASVVATTHYTELKKYALEKSGVENASMEFDVETLSPTYRLTIGVPGKSNAFEISEKLGLPGEIIQKARGLLEGGDLEFEQVLSAIEADKKAAEAERDEAVILHLEMKKQKEELEKKAADLEKRQTRMLNDAKEEARNIIAEARALSLEVQEDLRELAKLESLGERNKKFDESRKRIKDAAGRYKETFIKEVNDNPVNVKDIKLGDRVKVLSLGQNGEIITLPDDRGELVVQVGMIKARVNVDDLKLIPTGKRPKKAKAGYGAMYKAKAQTVSPSLQVIGQNLDEALDNVNKYIDDAFMAGLPEVTIVHGRGEGILMKGIREELGHNKHVDKYRKGNYNEGGDGVTLVKLKK